ncbi:Fe2+ or Zn2+ uptake regulation protein [Microbacterium sp. ZKA21]|jgi:Fe2+ or Zn2+ uptake regulation protein|uniref:Fur family transcriptional regulator n=1 Tax=Microbacterium sp. ZKA21 TaxID=3381694 RepID=UPI003D1F2695
MTIALHDTDDAIRAAGLRVTESRRAVFDALHAHPHASADEIHAAVRPLVESTSLQSVYNALGDFAAAGLVRRIEPAGHPMLFELRVDDNHHHLVCTRCGAVEDVDCSVGHAPCLVPSDAHGYRVAVAEVTYWGLCASCAAEDS